MADTLKVDVPARRVARAGTRTDENRRSAEELRRWRESRRNELRQQQLVVSWLRSLSVR